MQYFSDLLPSLPLPTVSSNRVLYTPSSFARSSLLHLQEIGTLRALKEHTSRHDGLRSLLFFIVLSGSGTLVYENKEYTQSPGDCVFIDCRKPYSHTTSTSLWSLCWCHFYGPTAASIYAKYCERGGKPSFHPADPAPFHTVLEHLQIAAKSEDYIRDMRINQLLSALCVLLMEQSWHPENAAKAGKQRSVADVKEYLDTHYAERISLDALASHFYINKYYLTRVFKEQIGLSITAYLLNVRITKAKQMLRFTDKTVEEIGLECGLGAAPYFSRTFKSVEGVPPSVFRSQW